MLAASHTPIITAPGGILTTVPPVSLTRLTWIFLRVGNLTFGGGDPTMAALQSELVLSRGWLSPDRYALVYGLARVTPGTNVLACCAGLAWEILGWSAALLAVPAATVPSAALVALLTAGYESWKSSGLAMAAIGGTLAAAVGLMGVSVWNLVAPAVRARRWLRIAAISGGSALLVLRLDLGPVQVLALAALAGLLWRAPAK